MDTSWLDLKSSTARVMEHGMTVRQFVDVSLNFSIFINTMYSLYSNSILTALCPDLANPTNGVVTLSGNSAGDTATYMCNGRFELVGVPVLNCQDDGTWDNPPPVCQSIEGEDPTGKQHESITKAKYYLLQILFDRLFV